MTTLTASRRKLSDEEIAENRRRRIRAYRARKRAEAGAPTPKPMNTTSDPRHIPAHVLRERDRLASIKLTPDQALLGDPLPGRSALDRKCAKALEPFMRDWGVVPKEEAERAVDSFFERVMR